MRTLARRTPILGRLMRWRRHERRYATELALIGGAKVSTSEHASILHFSINKAATQYVKRVLRRAAEPHGLTTVDLHGYAFHSRFPFLDSLSAEEMAEYRHLFKAQGYLYSVFGGMIDGIPDLESFRIVLAVRDPRDILVSEFFSTAYSHKPPVGDWRKAEVFQANRQKALSLGIDRYVLERTGHVAATFERYQRLLLDRVATVHVARYEQMVDDFEGWLDGLLASCSLDVPAELRQALVETHERTRPTREDPTQHLRKGQPGDFRNKLAGETVARLDEALSPILTRFGYA